MGKQNETLNLVQEGITFVGLLIKGIWWSIVDFIFYFKTREPKSVCGKVVLITGASRGLGREMALQFAALGAKVVLWSSKQENVEPVSKQICASGGYATAYQCDVGDEEQVQKTSKMVLEDLGHVDILINNAGISVAAPLLDIEVKDIRKIYNVNLLSHYWTIKQFLPKMMNRREGHIVAIGSICSYSTGPRGSAYCGTKHAMMALMDCVEQEICPDSNINFTTICPGFFESGLVANVRNRLGFLFPLPHAEDVARTAILGILTNQRIVDIPRRTGLFIRFGLLVLSKRAQVMFHNFINYTFDVVER